jgi:hypothetical protein
LLIDVHVGIVFHALVERLTLRAGVPVGWVSRRERNSPSVRTAP